MSILELEVNKVKEVRALKLVFYCDVSHQIWDWGDSHQHHVNQNGILNNIKRKWHVKKF